MSISKITLRPWDESEVTEAIKLINRVSGVNGELRQLRKYFEVGDWRINRLIELAERATQRDMQEALYTAASALRTIERRIETAKTKLSATEQEAAV